VAPSRLIATTGTCGQRPGRGRRAHERRLGGAVYDQTDPVGRLLFNVLAMVAEFEADLISMRTREGLKVARTRGRLRGKQPKLTVRQEAHLAALHAGGEYTPGELAELFRVGRSTVYRALQRVRVRNASTLAVSWFVLRLHGLSQL
jgi:DNA invertase Pin-like site-specific DNA recombinase